MLDKRPATVPAHTPGTRSAKPCGSVPTEKRLAQSGPSWRAWLWAGGIHFSAVGIVLAAGFAAQAMRPEVVERATYDVCLWGHRHGVAWRGPRCEAPYETPSEPPRCKGCGRRPAQDERPAREERPRMPLDTRTRASDSILLPKHPAPASLGGEEFWWREEHRDHHGPGD